MHKHGPSNRNQQVVLYFPLDNGRNSGKKWIEAGKITNDRVNFSGIKIHILKGREKMKLHNIAVIPADGIGEEVALEGVKALDVAGELTGEYKFKYEYFPYGCNYYVKHGKMMADDGLKILKSFDAIYFSTVGSPAVPDHISLRGLRLPICQGFEQYVCYRPTELLPGVKTPLANKKVGDIDFIVVRENTEGEYTGAGGRAHRGLPIEIAVETCVFSRVGIERVMRYWYKIAQGHRKKLVSTTKSNAQQHSFTFWDEVVKEVGKEFPDVTVERVLIDALSARFILHPESLDVVVASNLLGDILTDIAAAISGSWALRQAATSILNTIIHQCSSRFTVPRPTSWVKASRTRSR